ncbi:AlpA family transcriptional regulator [Dichelobacter nodosus]
MKIMRINEVVSKTSLKRTHIYQLIKEGKFPKGYKIGRARCWSEEEIVNFFKALEQEN